MTLLLRIFSFLWAVVHVAAAFSADLRPEEIVTVLPKDAIPAILSPSFDEGKKASWLKGKDFGVAEDCYLKGSHVTNRWRMC